jgi:hypothetical protein
VLVVVLVDVLVALQAQDCVPSSPHVPSLGFVVVVAVLGGPTGHV